MNTARTPVFLMANLGSEVAKIFSAREKVNLNMLEMATQKANEIISELKHLPETKDNKEIDILRDIILDIVKENHQYDIRAEHLRSYFYPFALRIMNT